MAGMLWETVWVSGWGHRGDIEDTGAILGLNWEGCWDHTGAILGR